MVMQPTGQVDSGERLFVTKIPPQVTQEDVAAHFSQFGTTTDVYLPSAPGRPGHKGIAFISFAEPAATQLAMTNVPHMVGGQEVVVDIAAPRGQRVDATGKVIAAGDRLFVTKVPPMLSRESMEKYFVQFGELTDVYMPAVPGSSTHKGICFVSYADSSAGQLCLQQPAHEVEGHPVVVDVAAPRGATPGGHKGGGKSHEAYRPPSGGKGWGGKGYAPPPSQPNGGGPPVPGRLFLTKVPTEVSKVDLQVYFQQFGELEDVYVPSNGKGIAFVSLRDHTQMYRVLQSKEHYVKPGVMVLVEQALDRPALGKGGGGGGGGGYRGYEGKGGGGGGKGYGGYHAPAPPPSYGGGYHHQGVQNAYGGSFNHGYHHQPWGGKGGGQPRVYSPY